MLIVETEQQINEIIMKDKQALCYIDTFNELLDRTQCENFLCLDFSIQDEPDKSLGIVVQRHGRETTSQQLNRYSTALKEAYDRLNQLDTEKTWNIEDF